ATLDVRLVLDLFPLGENDRVLDLRKPMKPMTLRIPQGTISGHTSLVIVEHVPGHHPERVMGFEPTTFTLAT
ncbi:hypothetical protein ACSTJV_23930, partial [Vibrio parahaemolyticus]